jgi:hypothetical protein
MSVLFEMDSVRPLDDFAPKFAAWLSNADRSENNADNVVLLEFYGQRLTAAEAVFCNSYARHLIFGTPAPNLEGGSIHSSPLYRQSLLEKVVREKLTRLDNYVMPLAIKI